MAVVDEVRTDLDKRMRAADGASGKRIWFLGKVAQAWGELPHRAIWLEQRAMMLG